MQIGAHVSISGSLDLAVDNAVERECNAFQIFTRNPRSWFAKDLDPVQVKKFKEKLQKSRIDRMATCAHMPYLPNLSSPDEDGYQKSIKSMTQEIERCHELGIPYLVTHLGSHKGSGEENGIRRLVGALNKVAETNADVIILMENTAGQKNSVGSDFTQLEENFSNQPLHQILSSFFSLPLLFSNHILQQMHDMYLNKYQTFLQVCTVQKFLQAV